MRAVMRSTAAQKLDQLRPNSRRTAPERRAAFGEAQCSKPNISRTHGFHEPHLAQPLVISYTAAKLMAMARARSCLMGWARLSQQHGKRPNHDLRTADPDQNFWPMSPACNTSDANR